MQKSIRDIISLKNQLLIAVWNSSIIVLGMNRQKDSRQLYL